MSASTASTELPSTVPTSTLWRSLIGRLSRVTSGGRFVPCVDGLRCVAILAVVLYHLSGYVVAKNTGFTEAEARETLTFHLLHGANCGVQLFFAISGFILALPFARENLGGQRRVSLKHYYLRRLTRLEPPFLINLIIVCGLLIVVSKHTFSELAGSLIATMTYTHNWIYGELSAINGVTWSLEIEVQFYILAPFLARWYFQAPPRRRRAVAVAMVVGWVLAKTLVPVDGPLRLRLGLLYTLDHFVTGIVIADLFIHDWKEAPTKHRLWDAVSVVAIPIMFLSQLKPDTVHLLPFISALLFVSAFRGPVTNRLLSLPLVVVTGGMCYSIYLYHFFVISLLGRATIPLTAGGGYLLQMFAQACVIVPLTIMVCAVFFVLIERPFMKWRPLAA